MYVCILVHLYCSLGKEIARVCVLFINVFEGMQASTVQYVCMYVILRYLTNQQKLVQREIQVLDCQSSDDDEASNCSSVMVYV